MTLAARIHAGLDRWFCITERGSSITTELRAGIVTFLTMSYILLVNPQILASAGLPLREVVSSTALTSCLASFGVGVLANLPVGIAPGMGLNAYLVFSQVLGAGTSVNVALACCMVAAAVVAVLAVLRALTLILHLVPHAIKLAVVVGMGLLLSFIGLQTAHVVVPDPETLVTMGDLRSAEVSLAALGLTLIATLHYRNVPGAIIIGILLTALGYYTVKGAWPHQFVSLPSLGCWRLDMAPIMAMDPAALSAVVAYALVMIFDIGGAMYGLCGLAGLIKADGGVPGAIPTYLSAAAGTALGAVTGTTPLIIAAESAVGIQEGGRTGLVAVTVSACFAISLFFAPILQAVPQVATAPVLVLVGAMMMGEASHINWRSMPTAVPAFLTMVIQPFTFSIANGIYAGLLFSFILWITTGHAFEYCKSLLSPTPSPDTLVLLDGMEATTMPECVIENPAAAAVTTGTNGHSMNDSMGMMTTIISSPVDSLFQQAMGNQSLTQPLLVPGDRNSTQRGSVASSPLSRTSGHGGPSAVSGDHAGALGMLSTSLSRTGQLARSVQRRLVQDYMHSQPYTSTTHDLLLSTQRSDAAAHSMGTPGALRTASGMSSLTQDAHSPAAHHHASLGHPYTHQHPSHSQPAQYASSWSQQQHHHLHHQQQYGATTTTATYHGTVPSSTDNSLRGGAAYVDHADTGNPQRASESRSQRASE